MYTVTLNGATKEEATIDEQMLLGAGRVGLRQASQLTWSNVTSIPAETSLWLNKLGKKRYELSNHLGNVNAVITDRKVVNTGYAVLVNDTYTSTNPAWSTSSSCGAITQSLSGGMLTTTNGNCTFQINRIVAAAASTSYTFSVDIVNRNNITGFDIELYAAPVSGTFTLVAPVFTNIQNGKFSYTFTTPAGTTQVKYMFRKLSTETGMGFAMDNLYLGTTAAQYEAVALQKMDYYPFGMEMTGGIELGSIPASVTGSGAIVEEPVAFTNMYNTFTNTSGDLEVAAGSVSGSQDNAANSLQTVLPGEYIEFTASPDPIATNRTFVGLSYVDNGFLYTTINYSWYLYPDGRSFVYENGAQPYTNNVAYVPGVTTYRIARTGGNIVYYKNGVAVRTVADANPTTPMIVDITIWNTGTTDKAKVYHLKVGKLSQVFATYASGDYVPYVHSDYRFGYNGMEKDPEMKGDGNSLDYGARQYDPRLGRWMTQDPLKYSYPSTSPYCYALNTPIGAKDADGRYTIFVNGYIYGYIPGPSDDIKPGKPYWREQGEEFVNAAHTYFGDGYGEYVDGTGASMSSTASARQLKGRLYGKKMAEELIVQIQDAIDKGIPVEEINFVTHSMGAAFAEGMIEEFMKYPALAKLLEKGTIVHFSACDGNEIVISENSQHLDRTQMNYAGEWQGWQADFTLSAADNGATRTGGYHIPGVSKFYVVKADMKVLHPYVYKHNQEWDFHYDTKSFKEPWEFMKLLDQRLKLNPLLQDGSPNFINSDELNGVDSEIKTGGSSESPTENKG